MKNEGNDLILSALMEFHDNHSAYLNAIICISRIESLAESLPSPLSDELAELARHTGKIGMNFKEYFFANLFFSQITGIEIFFQRMMKISIMRHPKKLGGTQIKLEDAINSGSINDLVERVADNYFNNLTYKKPFEYLKDICKILSIEEAVVAPLWPAFIEAKARRDVGIHNNWICNATYLRKVREAGLKAVENIGDLLIPADFKYMKTATTNMLQIAHAICLATAKKI